MSTPRRTASELRPSAIRAIVSDATTRVAGDIPATSAGSASSRRMIRLLPWLAIGAAATCLSLLALLFSASPLTRARDMIAWFGSESGGIGDQSSRETGGGIHGGKYGALYGGTDGAMHGALSAEEVDRPFLESPYVRRIHEDMWGGGALHMPSEIDQWVQRGGCMRLVHRMALDLRIDLPLSPHVHAHTGASGSSLPIPSLPPSPPHSLISLPLLPLPHSLSPTLPHLFRPASQWVQQGGCMRLVHRMARDLRIDLPLSPHAHAHTGASGSSNSGAGTSSVDSSSSSGGGGGSSSDSGSSDAGISGSQDATPVPAASGPDLRPLLLSLLAHFSSNPHTQTRSPTAAADAAAGAAAAASAVAAFVKDEGGGNTDPPPTCRHAHERHVAVHTDPPPTCQHAHERHVAVHVRAHPAWFSSHYGTAMGLQGHHHCPSCNLSCSVRAVDAVKFGALLASQNVGFSECWLLRMLASQNVGFSECLLLRMLASQNVCFSECLLLRMFASQNVSWDPVTAATAHAHLHVRGAQASTAAAAAAGSAAAAASAAGSAAAAASAAGSATGLPLTYVGINDDLTRPHMRSAAKMQLSLSSAPSPSPLLPSFPSHFIVCLPASFSSFTSLLPPSFHLPFPFSPIHLLSLPSPHTLLQSTPTLHLASHCSPTWRDDLASSVLAALPRHHSFGACRNNMRPITEQKAHPGCRYDPSPSFHSHSLPPSRFPPSNPVSSLHSLSLPPSSFPLSMHQIGSRYSFNFCFSSSPLFRVG
ncbi:unnamed protein product [Closterium sp. Naga37s-1]|nr:unnamed protein product [Closterium sp. Naga37s-1]